MGTIRVFNHYVKTAFVLLGLAEAAALVAAVYGGAYLRFSQDFDAALASLGPLWPKAALFAAAIMVAMTATGLYQRRLREGPLGIVRRVTVSFVIAVILLTLAFYALPSLYLGRGVLAIAFAVALVGLLGCRLFFLQVLNRRGLKRRVLVLGSGQRAAAMTELRRKSDRFGLDFLGYIKHGDIAPQIDPGQCIELNEPLSEYATRHNIDEIVVALDDRRNALPVRELLECRIRGVEITDILSFFERETGKVKVDLMYPSWLAYSHGFFYRGSVRQFTKRLLDIAVSLAFIAVLWPVMAAAAIAIVAESGRPILYRQRRVGANGGEFSLLKFRSMYQNAEQHGAKWAAEDDPRITRVGAFLRKYRIDEMPQIFNILRGEMSFVGPRPERPDFVEGLREKLPYYAERHRVKPGLTGWAQVIYPYGASEKDAFEKLQYDLYYVKNYSFFLDLMILLQTTEVVLWGKGAR